MRKLFYIAMALFAAITVNTSCGVNGEDTQTITTMATVIEGTSSIPYSLVFDDGKTAYVTNMNKWSPSFSETQKELRYIVSYLIINETSSIFDMEVELVENGALTGKFIIAIDSVGAGIGETVLITTGSSARLALHNTSSPADAVIVGIVD